MTLSKRTRIISLLLATVVAALSMSACAKKEGGGSGSDGDGDEKSNYTMSMGVVLSTDRTSKGSAQCVSTVAAVITDKDSRIVDCSIDCAQNKMDISAGTVETGQAYKTKREQGADYGLADASGIGKEWYEQASFFAEYVKGMDEKKVSGIDIGDGGEALGADLKAGCTIDISDMKKALLKALQSGDASVSISSDKEPTLKLAMQTYDTSSKSATENSSGIAAMYTDFCAVAETDGRIDGAIIDSAEPKIAFNKSGEPGEITYSGTKLEQGKDYGMLIASTIGKEWYEQIEFFCSHIKGMSADEVAAISVKKDGKTDDETLISGCTVSVDKYIKAVTKAMRG